MKFENVLLGLLSVKPFSGYDLMKWFDTEGQFLRSNTHHSQIYRELGRMVRDGLVEFDVDPREGRPDAKVYRITPIGSDVLLEWVRSPYVPTSRFQDADFNARLLFAVPLDVDAAVRVIETELAYRVEQVANSRIRKRGVVGIDPVPGFDARRYADIGEQMHLFGAVSVDQWITWLERMRARLTVEPALADDTTKEQPA